MLHAKLREIRESKRLNQTQFGNLIGVNLNTVSAFERGDRLPDIDYLIHLAELTQEDLTELIKLRVEASPKFNPLEKSPSKSFISHINRDDVFKEIAIRKKMTEKVDLQRDQFTFQKSNDLPVSINDHCLVDGVLILNCYEAIKLLFDRFKNMEISEQITYLVKFYNNLFKMSQALGTTMSDLKVLEIKGMIKQLEILIALKKIEAI